MVSAAHLRVRPVGCVVSAGALVGSSVPATNELLNALLAGCCGTRWPSCVGCSQWRVYVHPGPRAIAIPPPLRVPRLPLWACVRAVRACLRAVRACVRAGRAGVSTCMHVCVRAVPCVPCVRACLHAHVLVFACMRAQCVQENFLELFLTKSFSCEPAPAPEPNLQMSSQPGLIGVSAASSGGGTSS